MCISYPENSSLLTNKYKIFGIGKKQKGKKGKKWILPFEFIFEISFYFLLLGWALAQAHFLFKGAHTPRCHLIDTFQALKCRKLHPFSNSNSKPCLLPPRTTGELISCRWRRPSSGTSTLWSGCHQWPRRRTGVEQRKRFKRGRRARGLGGESPWRGSGGGSGGRSPREGGRGRRSGWDATW